VHNEEPDITGSSPPDLGPRAVSNAFLQMQPWFASAPNGGFDGLHSLMLSQGSKVG
jgi:hypothetical protein